MSKKLNLIFSILSLVTTTILLIVTVYSWYTQNEVVQVKSIVGQTENQDTNYELYYWKESTSSWAVVTEIKEKNVLPGKTTYFRLKCVNNSGSSVKLTAKFQGIQSRLDTNYVKVSADGKTINYSGIKAYDIANNKVEVDPVVVGETTKTVLYNVSNKNITLGQFKIEDGYVIQKYGTTETHTGAIDNIDDATSDLIGVGDEVLSSWNVAVDTSYYYFSLTYLHDADINNYYMYQELYIDSLTMFESE